MHVVRCLSIVHVVHCLSIVAYGTLRVVLASASLIVLEKVAQANQANCFQLNFLCWQVSSLTYNSTVV